MSFASRAVKDFAIELAKRTRRFTDWTDAEKQTLQADPVFFRGDIPARAGRQHNQYRVVYAQDRTLITHADQVTYTQAGMAWQGQSLKRRFSFQEIGFRQIYEGRGRATQRYERASILQAQTPRTYGDWVSEHVAALALALARGALVEPLLLPAWWHAKPYVERDLATLGVSARSVDRSVLIERATVINKTRPGHYWTPEEVQAARFALRIVSQPCEAGTALYLSRKGERGEGPQRQIDNDLTEAAMRSAGVTVVRTAGLSARGFADLARSAETVFADHGSALYNLMYWDTRRVVELFAPDYWDSAFPFFAVGLGIADYHLWQIDHATTADGLARRARELLELPAPGRSEAAIDRYSERRTDASSET